MEYAVRKLTVAGAGVDFLVRLIRYAIGVIVPFSISKFLTKFREARFTRSSGLLDPLVPIERLSVSEKYRPK